MIGAHRSLVVRLVSVLMVPLILMFGLYVIAHGHYGPGGGFAGGVVVGVGVILSRITIASGSSLRWFPPTAARAAAGVGVLIYLGVGLASLVGGGAYLDYGQLEVLGETGPERRYLGIFVVEVGVGITVAGVMVGLFDTLAGETAPDLDLDLPAPVSDRSAEEPPEGGGER